MTGVQTCALPISVSLALKAGKEILQNESIEDNVVLNEEIKRIKQLLK